MKKTDEKKFSATPAFTQSFGKHDPKSQINKVTPDKYEYHERPIQAKSATSWSNPSSNMQQRPLARLVDMATTRLKPCQRLSRRLVYATELFSDAVPWFWPERQSGLIPDSLLQRWTNMHRPALHRIPAGTLRKLVILSQCAATAKCKLRPVDHNHHWLILPLLPPPSTKKP